MNFISKTGRWLSITSVICLSFFSTVFGVQPPGAQVTLGWSASPDPTVVGYYLYDGSASGTYTNKIAVGTNTTFTMSGLSVGSTNYFAVTSYNAAGLESINSTEFTYVVPPMLSVTQNPTNGVIRVQFPVVSGQFYQLQTSSNLRSWSNLWLTATQTNNGSIEYDEPMTNTISARFYRLIVN